MSCEKPLLFLDLGKKENGSRNLKMIPPRVDYNIRVLQQKYGEANVLLVPCGKCPSCIKNYRRQWSLRCEAEAKCHKVSCFITLTYDPEHNPGVLVKGHLKEFIKKLRNRGIAVRYFGCGEYASQPHYHIILFGYMPDDLSLISKSKSGFHLYKSKFVENLWKKGLCTVQEFDSAVAGYVAGYVDKKIEDRDSFLIMSNRPGIGHDYYIRHVMKLYENDNFISKNGFVAGLPRYADKVADSFFYDLSETKDKRIDKSRKMTLAQCVQHGFSNLEEVYEYQGQIERRKKKYARSL